jgi:hypothetical protein
MKKIILVIIALFILSGCDLLNGPSARISEEQIHLGTEGLVINFIDNMPPDAVYDKENFPIGIKIENRGAYDVMDGNLILNLEKDVLEPKNGIKKQIKIKGKSISNPYGNTDTFNFLVQAKDLSKETETITTKVIVTSCYKYQTVFSDTFCVDTDYYNLKKTTKACNAEDKEYGSGQGGPLAITQIESKMMSEDNILKPVFIIHARNEGVGGIISSSGVSDACSEKGISKEQINRLDDNIKVNFASQGEDLKCKSSTSINLELNEEEIIIRCTLEEGINKDVEPYTSVLNIVIGYGYTETLSKEVEIKKMVG